MHIHALQALERNFLKSIISSAVHLDFSPRAERLQSAIEAIIPDGPMLRPLRRKVAEEYIITVLLQCSS
jgi:hypothetical protein|tara:strand:+ start:30308 stop:30514 length:207 start_codon:yes stop_codon:yes gene_type:complete